METVFIFVVALVLVIPGILVVQVMMRTDNPKLFSILFMGWILSVVALTSFSNHILGKYFVDTVEHTKVVCTPETSYEVKSR